MRVSVPGATLFVEVLNPSLAQEGPNLVEMPPLLCVPGGPGADHQALRPAYDRLTRYAQVFMLDPRGAGRSDACGPADWTLDRWADDIHAVVRALGLDRPIVLGVSAGAMMVGRYLARHPRHARAAILVNACARLDLADIVEGFRQRGGEEAANAARAMLTRHGVEDAPAFFQHALPFYAHPPGRRPFPPHQAMNFAAAAHFFASSREAFSFDLRGALGEVAANVLALVGAHDPLTQPQWGREVAAALPADRCRLVEFENASHLIEQDEPEAFWREVEGFLAAQA